MKNKFAFTLIELLVVIVILSVIVGLSVPNFSKSLGHFELKKTADDIVYLVRWAQSRAINDNVDYQFILSNDLKTYRILHAKSSQDTNSEVFIPIAIHMGRTFKLPSSVKVKENPGSFKIYPDGTLDKIRIRLEGQGGALIISSMEQRGSLFILEENDES